MDKIQFNFWKSADIGDLEILKESVENGADIHAIDPDTNWNAFHLVAYYGHRECFYYLASLGIDIDLPNHSMSTPLHLTAKQGHLRILQYLVENNASINAQSSEGYTALHHIASSTFNHDCTRYLLEKGIDTSLKDLSGKTALEHAKEINNQVFVDFLSSYLAAKDEDATLVDAIHVNSAEQAISF